MNADFLSALPWISLTSLAVVLAGAFGYIYRKDKDQRKLMFMFAFAFASLGFIHEMHPAFENAWTVGGLASWSSLPLLSAVLIAVASSLLRIKNFGKAFRIFLLAVVASIFLIIVPLPVKFVLPIAYQCVSTIVIAMLIYMLLSRREVSDLMFLLSIVCFVLGGLGMTGDLGVGLVVFAFVFAYIFIALVFVSSKEGVSGGIAAFFALENKLKMVEEDLRVAQEKLVEAERLAAIGRAATMVGHDLRNPLQAIRNATFIIESELRQLANSHSIAIPDKAAKMLKVIGKSIDYSDKIVNDLKDYTSTRSPFLNKVDINTLVEETLSQIEVPENVDLITEMGETQKIDVDASMMKRIFHNLLINGIQAMEENGGTLKVSTWEAKDFIEVSFEDTGIGIPEENIEKIFSPFFTTRAQGMGMGLAICKKFVQNHNGTIVVESEEGKGSTFTVRLPVQKEKTSMHTFIKSDKIMVKSKTNMQNTFS